MSDIHRSDKLRKAQKQIVAKPKKYLRKINLARKSLKDYYLTVTDKVEEAEQITLKVSNKTLGVDNFVVFAPGSLTCTCSQHLEQVFCADLVFVLNTMNIRDLSIVEHFSSENLDTIKQFSRKLVIGSNSESSILEIVRSKRNIKCSACIYLRIVV